MGQNEISNFRKSVTATITDFETKKTGSYEDYCDRGIDFYEYLIPGLRAQTLIQIMKNHGRIRIGDIGCGTGRALKQMQMMYGSDPNYQVDIMGVNLVEFPPIDSQFALEKNEFIEADILACAEEDLGGKFNLVLAVGSLNVSFMIEAGGQKALSLLAPGGIFIMADNTANFILDDQPEGNKFATERLITLAEGNNFAVVQKMLRHGARRQTRVTYFTSEK